MSEEQMQLTEAQEQHLRQCFSDFDKDGSGRLDVSETKEFLQILGLNPTESEVQDIVSKVDVDESNSLDYEEFKTLVVPVIQNALQSMRQGFEEAFKEFDKDGNGKLDKEEFRDAVTNKGDNKMSDEEVDELFEAVDADEDGKINIDEMITLFCAAMDAFSQQEDAHGDEDA